MVAERVEEAVWEFVVGLLVEPERMIAGVDGLIEQERLQLNGDPEREVRMMRRELHELDLRRERAQSGAVRELIEEGPIDGEMLRAQLSEIELAKEEVLRQLDASGNHGGRLRQLIDLRNRLQQRVAIWGRLLQEHPDLPQYVVEGAPVPWENDVFARAQREALENATPEQRREHYLSLGLRVEARSKEELEVSGPFGRKIVYIGSPLPRLRLTATTSSASTPTG